MDVDPETFKLLKKMWKPHKGHNSKSYGPLAPILLPHLLFFRDHVWYKFHGSRTTNIEIIQQNVKSRNYGITEWHGKSNIAPLFQSGAIIRNRCRIIFPLPYFLCIISAFLGKAVQKLENAKVKKGYNSFIIYGIKSNVSQVIYFSA